MTPTDTLQVLERYAAVILPGLVVAEQIGIPLPAVPALLAVGALAAQGRVNVYLILASIAVVAIVVDQGWYELGRGRGPAALTTLCRWSLERASWFRRTQAPAPPRRSSSATAREDSWPPNSSLG